MRLISFFKSSFLLTILRFDLAILCCAALTGLIISRIKIQNDMPSIYASLICGTLWFIGCKLWVESRTFNRIYFYLIALPVFALTVYYFQTLPKYGFFPQTTLFFSLLSFIFVSPFIWRNSNSDEVWSFYFHVIKNTMFAGFSSIVLFAGVTLILIALKYLLGFQLYSNQYIDMSVLISWFICPLLIMTGIPSEFKTHSTLNHKGEILLKFLLYIVIPLLLIYGIILHIYSIKIFIAGDLPRGKVAYLVAGFSSFLIITYIFTQRWKKQHPAIKLFCKYTGLFMIIPLSLMGWGAWERISTLGLTEARYLLSTFGIWLVISSFLIISQSKNSILWIVGTFSSLSLITSGGPWGVTELPIKHQLYRLDNVLVSIKTNHKQTIQKEQQLIIASILDYLETRNRLERVYEIYSNGNKNTEEKLSARTISKLLKVPYTEKSLRIKHYPQRLLK